MAAYRTADAGTGGFSVERWLKIVLWPQYTAAFRSRGYVTYERCANLSKKDVRAAVDNHLATVKLMHRVEDLRRLSEEDTAKILWVSTYYSSQVYCLYICMNERNIFVAAFSGPLLYTSVLYTDDIQCKCS